jgi:hypothetical protein
MSTISSTTTTGKLGANATLGGTGFGASQGTSVVLFYPTTDGATVKATIVSWGATQIVASIPDTAPVGQTGFFAVQVSSDQGVGARSASFAILAADPTPLVSLAGGTRVVLLPGTQGTLQ